jgi:hypothetical protein
MLYSIKLSTLKKFCTNKKVEGATKNLEGA